MSRRIVGYSIGNRLDLCSSCARIVFGPGELKRFPHRFKILEGYQNDPETQEYCHEIKINEGLDWNGEIPCLRCDEIIGRLGVMDNDHERFLRSHPSGIWEITEEHIERSLANK